MVFQRDFGAKRRAARVHSGGIASFDPSVRRLLDPNETLDEMSLLVQHADVRVSRVLPYQDFTHARMAALLAGMKSATDRGVVVRMILSTASIFTTGIIDDLSSASPTRPRTCTRRWNAPRPTGWPM
jgi:hypothetical protein